MKKTSKKAEFTDTLKHGKCKGRGQLHNGNVTPDHCVNDNAGKPLHECPDQDHFWVKSSDKCNCCDDCHSHCFMVHTARGDKKIGNMYEEWKKYISNDDGS